MNDVFTYAPQEVKDAIRIRNVFMSERKTGINMVFIGAILSLIFWLNWGTNGNAISLVIAVSMTIMAGCGAWKWTLAIDAILKAESVITMYLEVRRIIK